MTPGVPLPPDDSLAPLLACLRRALGHEVPNQLVAIQGLVRLLNEEEGARLGADGRDYLGRVAAGARRLHALAAELAGLVRLQEAAPVPERVDFAEAVAEVAAELKQLDSGLTLVYDPLRSAPSLAVSPSAFRRVLLLLVRHLAAAGPAGGRRVELRCATADGRAVARVVVEGTPLTAARRERLFEPFAEPGETGLELFVARRLAEAWGGSLRLDEDTGAGTAFLLDAPLTTEGSSHDPEPAPVRGRG